MKAVRVFCFLLIALLVADGMALIPGARANIGPFEAVWNDASGWDTGTKISTDSATDSCLASGPGMQLNATGGFYGVSERCPTTSPDIGLSNLSFSGDILTTLNSGKEFKDFSQNRRSIINAGANIVAAAPIGGGAVYIGGSSAMYGQVDYGAPNTGFFYPATLQKWSMNAWVRLNMTTCSPDVCTLIYDGGFLSGTGYIWLYFVDPTAGTSALYFQYYSGGTQYVVLGTVPTGAWHSISVRANYTTKIVDFFLDGGFVARSSLTGTPVYPPTLSRNLWIGNTANSGSRDVFRSTLGPLELFSRWITNDEADNYSYAGEYATSGFWYSDYINVTNLQPYYIALGTANTSDFSYISALYIFDSNDTELWHDFDIFYETRNVNLTHIILPTGSEWPDGSQTYYLGIALASPGNETVQLTYAALIFAPFAANPPTLDANAVIFLFFIFAFFALLLVGYMLDSMIPMMIDGILLFLMSFQVWDYTASIPITLGLVVVGILFMAFPVVQAFGILKGAKT